MTKLIDWFLTTLERMAASHGVLSLASQYTRHRPIVSQEDA